MVRLTGKFATNHCLNIPSYLKYVATLPGGQKLLLIVVMLIGRLMWVYYWLVPSVTDLLLIFTGRMPFLPPNQQRQSTEGKSHTRTVVRECCTGDDQSQWEMGKFDPRHPKTPQPMFTKICVGDYVGDIYHHAQFYPNRFRGFGSAHASFRAPRHKVTRLFFGSWERLPPRRARRFWRKIRQTTRFRARQCLLGVAKPKSKVSTPIFPKTAIFGPHFDRTEFFSPENGFSIGRLESKRPLIVIGAQ